MDYSRFTAKDFALDDFFLKWVKNPTAETDTFWQQWLASHPEKRAEVETARSLVRQIAFRTYAAGPEAGAEGWKTLSAAIDAWENARPAETSAAAGPVRPLYAPRTGWLRIAASFAALLLAAAGYVWYTYTARTTLRTGYGETRRIVLADRSVVTLNANSSLSYRRHWGGNGNREVWLEGEAFFEVVHTINHRKFVVHAAGNLDVEVLGTKFNVYGRKRSTRVLLNDGKVQLNIGQDRRRQVTMRPGELVELDATGGYVRKVVDPAQHASWVHRYLLFKDTPAGEVVALLEDTHGVTVELPDPALLQSKITGRVPINNLESLLFALSESLDCDVSRDGGRIVFRPRSGSSAATPGSRP
jgi:ferric-dicitrate binding protein FerR (iron transport regulator)